MPKPGSCAPAVRQSLPAWGILLVAAFVGASIGTGYALFNRPYQATVRLFAFERAFNSAAETADFLALANGVTAAQVPTNISFSVFPKQACSATADPKSAAITIVATHANPETARTVAESSAAKVIELAPQWACDRTNTLRHQLSAIQDQMAGIRSRFKEFGDALLRSDLIDLRRALSEETQARSSTVAELRTQLSQISADEKKTRAALAVETPGMAKLEQELDQALTRYTEEHPKVKELRAAMALLEKNATGRTNDKPSIKSNVQLAELNSRRESLLQDLKLAEAELAKTRQKLEDFSNNEVEFAALLSEYRALTTRRDELIQSRILVNNRGLENWRQPEAAEVTRILPLPYAGALVATGAGLFALATVLILPVSRRRKRVIRDRETLELASGLRVLCSLTHLDSLDSAGREHWAVESLELMRQAAGVKRRGCFICGLISSRHHEGRSTWIDLLAKAALKNGNRVLVVSGPRSSPGAVAASDSASKTGTSAAPGMLVARTRTEENGGELARYEFPDLKQVQIQRYWEQTLDIWQQEENAVILVELPPANTADSLLLASAVPNVVWLSASYLAETASTERFVASLRNTGCNLIGAALNYA